MGWEHICEHGRCSEVQCDSGETILVAEKKHPAYLRASLIDEVGTMSSTFKLFSSYTYSLGNLIQSWAMDTKLWG